MIEKTTVQAVDHALELQREASSTNQRRVVVLAGSREASYRSANAILDALPVGISDTVALSRRDSWRCERIDPTRSTRLMGRTVGALVLDFHDATIPNAIGRATGALDGGGLLLMLTPPFDNWGDGVDAFARQLVVAPYELADVGGAFRSHLSDTLDGHPGISLVDADSGSIIRSGQIDRQPASISLRTLSPPTDSRFPGAAYRACQSRDQSRILRSFEQLLDPGHAIVVTAERGRGKSSVAGIAAGCLLVSGCDVGVSAPGYDNVRALFRRCEDILERLDEEVHRTDNPHPELDTSRGTLRFIDPDHISEHEDLDVLIIDEAAGVPVPQLVDTLAIDRIAFMTTVFGYEGSGQGFSARFVNRLEKAPHSVIRLGMTTPIRYASNDPIESWLNRALFLDARPVDTTAVSDLDPDDLTYREWEASTLLSQPHMLRQMIGLLASAHYRTEPNDLARILDAPNLDIVTLDDGGSVHAVALLAREGNLSKEDRQAAFRGTRLRANMLPDIFINEFQDLAPAGESGLRIVRIATHEAVRRRGLGTQLVEHIRRTHAECAWIGTGFGITPELVDFWVTNGFEPIFVAASRNRSSGVHSVVMLDTSNPTLVRRYGDVLPRRLRGSLSDVHRSMSPEAAMAVLEASDARLSLSLSESSWRGLVGASHGPGRYDLDPEPARHLVIHHLATETETSLLEDEQGLLLVRKILQGYPWERVATEMGFPSIGQARRAVGDALVPLVDEYGGAFVSEERERFEEAS